jgi:phosphate uptake regulator
VRTVFRQILSLFRGTDPLRVTLEMFAGMITDSRWMYEQVLDVYTGTQTAPDLEPALFSRDRRINATERQIRRRLVEYLSITENPDVGSCLVLMSVAKDAERIGDYIKNMFDVASHLHTKTQKYPDVALSTHQLRSRLLPIFDATREAFLTSNEKMAQRTLEEARAIAREAEKMVWKIAESKDFSNKTAVFYALSARHLKRIASHLGNIATAVVQPVDWLDYTDEPLLGKGAETPSVKSEE